MYSHRILSRGVLPLLLVALLMAPGIGCAFQKHRETLDQLAASGRYQRAAELLDTKEIRSLYNPKNAALWDLERGAVALALNDDAAAFESLERAERFTEYYYRQPPREVVGRWLVGEKVATYIPRPYEDIYVNVLKLLAHLESGRIEGYATVEARRLISKTNLLRDRYLEYEDAVKDNNVASKAQRASLIAVNSEGQFVESPLGTYLSALTFMQADQRDFQDVAARRLQDALRLQDGIIGRVDPDHFTSLAELRPGDVNVLAVALSGRSPKLFSERFGPLVIYTVPLYFELPVMRTFPSEVAASRIEVQGGPAVDMDLIEDMAAVAAENHQRDLPQIYTRTALRVAAKAGLTAALAEVGRKNAADNDQGLVEIGAALAGLFVMASTEQADTRSWAFLPGRAHVGLLKLPPGEHRVRVVYESAAGGSVYTTPWEVVRVTEEGLSTIVTHYWR